jgi:hypothetical protein
MIWIDEGDEPVLAQVMVNGKPGFIVLASGEDDDEIVFVSHKALTSWVDKLERLAAYPQDAQPYEVWLEGQE